MVTVYRPKDLGVLISGDKTAWECGEPPTGKQADSHHYQLHHFCRPPVRQFCHVGITKYNPVLPRSGHECQNYKKISIQLFAFKCQYIFYQENK